MPSLHLHRNQPFSLDATLSCGQVFRWERAPDGWWYGVVGSRAMKIRQEGRKLCFAGVSAEFIRSYFSLDTDLAAILDSIDADPFIHACIAQNRGLRLVRQPPWECTVSYICATNSNIPTIRRRIAAIAKTFGTPTEFEGCTWYGFPDPVAICSGGGSLIGTCRLGYREPYVLCTSGLVTDEDGWEEKIRSLPYADARRELTRLSGIGTKAADCILLFAFQKYEAFPVDVWIRRIIGEHYLPDLDCTHPLTPREYEHIRQFAKGHFGEYCGYAQEYLYAARETV